MESNDQVEEAILFLLHQDVINMPSNTKQKFLQDKGLSPDEIHRAFSEAAIRSQRSGSFWETIANNAAAAVILGGACYIGYRGFRRFVRWINGSVEHEREIAERERILSTLDDIRERIQHLDQRLTPIEGRLRDVEGNIMIDRQTIQREQQDLRSQLNSLKSIMLSSKSFSPIPSQSSILSAANRNNNDTNNSSNSSLLSSSTTNISTSQATVRVPAWQLASKVNISDTTTTTMPSTKQNSGGTNGTNSSKVEDKVSLSSKQGKALLEDESNHQSDEENGLDHDNQTS